MLLHFATEPLWRQTTTNTLKRDLKLRNLAILPLPLPLRLDHLRLASGKQARVREHSGELFRQDHGTVSLEAGKGWREQKNGMRSKINGAKKIFARRHTQSFVRTLLSKRTLYDERNGKAIAKVTSVPRPFVLEVRIVLRMRGKKERERMKT